MSDIKNYKYRIYSLKEANQNHHNFTHIVSIGDTNCGDDEHVVGFKGEIYKLKFHDYEFRDDNLEQDRQQKQISKTGDISYKAPKYSHVEEIGDYFKKYIAEDKGDRMFMVHCYAGISRSSAIMIQHLLMTGKSIEETLQIVDIIRPMASPNRLLIEYIDKYLKMDGKLEEAVDKRDLKFSTGLFNSPKFRNFKGDDRK